MIMKVVVAVDSFKGCLSSMEAGLAARAGVLSAHPEARVIVKPLADGGEGTTEALMEGLRSERMDLMVTGPAGKPVHAFYGILKDTNTAVMEMAQAAGITLMKKKDPLHATTYGVGEMIFDAIGRGIREFIIGIGGSATNDGGIGMLKALGWQFLDQEGNDAGQGAQALSKVACIFPPDESRQKVLQNCRFQVACDVKNPLCGPFGATYIFGPQKGVTDEMKAPVDQAMVHYADVTASALSRDNRDVPGTGAAGGLGFAFYSYLNASLEPGVDLILKAIGLEEDLEDTDVIVTGEGRLDAQTAMGKAPVGVAQLAKRYGVKVIGIAGSISDDAEACNEAGIDAYFPVVRGITTLEEAMHPEQARKHIQQTTEQIFRLL